MTESTYLSTAQVSEALGVGVSTIKRWVDQGILTARKTPGGHRKLLLADVLRLAKDNHFPEVDWTKLQGNADRPPLDPDRLRRRLHYALMQGRGSQASDLLREAFRRGLGIAALGDQVIGPTMHAIGLDWEARRIDVYQEHQASQLCAAGLFELRQLLQDPARGGRPLALVAGFPGDPCMLAPLLVELALLEAGWQVNNCGPNTPFSSLSRALVEQKPRLVCLSLNHPQDEAQFRADYSDFFQRAREAGVPVAVGGQGLSADLRSRIPYTTFGDGLAHLQAFAQTLYARPRRPNRGRPRGRSSRSTQS